MHIKRAPLARRASAGHDDEVIYLRVVSLERERESDATHESEVDDLEHAKRDCPTMPFRAFNSSQRLAFLDEYETIGSDGKVLIK